MGLFDFSFNNFNSMNFGANLFQPFSCTPMFNLGLFNQWTRPFNDIFSINTSIYSSQFPYFNNTFTPTFYDVTFWNFDNKISNISVFPENKPVYNNSQTYLTQNSYYFTEPVSKKNETISYTPIVNTESKHWSKMTDSEMKSVYGNYTRDITDLYDGSAEKLNKYLNNKGVLQGKGESFMRAQEKYGISASVLVGIAVNETGNGKSNLALNKNNVGGIRISGSTEFKTFDSVDDCIMEMARILKEHYVNNSNLSLFKLYQVNAKYCPASDTTDTEGVNNNWASAVEMYASEVEKIDA